MMEVKDYKKSFGMFLSEAVMKPWQPLGVEMFFPCKSGNWKGALQQWLVVHLYQFVLLLIRITIRNMQLRIDENDEYEDDEVPSWSPAFLVLYIFLVVLWTWHFWFALTQRNPIGFPATPCGILWGAGAILPTCLTGFLLWEVGKWVIWGDRLYEYIPEWLYLTLCVVSPLLICSLCTSCFVIESKRLVAVLGLFATMLFSYVLIILPLEIMSAGRIRTEIGNILLRILLGVTQLYIGICAFMIGTEKANKQVEVPQEETEPQEKEDPGDSISGKRTTSKQSVSTAPTDEENPTAGTAQEGVLDQP
jgi:hypothetical protein